VGIGLSRLFSASKFEDPVVGEDTELANSMGLFLQKINIIRDYLEDSLEGRIFWPKQVIIIFILNRRLLSRLMLGVGKSANGIEVARIK
jgi:phytoene/squalene synthetase